MTSQKVPQSIIDLVESFDREKEEFGNPKEFDEENTKMNFINPFFEALGWDVHNKEKKSLHTRDVEFEKKLKRDGVLRKPDYAFRINGDDVFFVEAKKPGVNIESYEKTALQARRYGWSAKLPLCILTDFEELSVYETITKPGDHQDPKISRVKYYKYTDYIEKWDEIASIFSKSAVLNGQFLDFVKSLKLDYGKASSSVDKEFLKEIENWRLLLARDIAHKNPELPTEDLNYAVQVIIDRIIFLRMAEDRGIEEYETLFNLLTEENIYKSFTKLCIQADTKYNSGLFHFDEKNAGDTLDTFTLDLEIGNTVLKKIFKNLYFPNSPYEFSVLPAKILGDIYEKFLGNVIRVIRTTTTPRVIIEEKPEVKKAGGIYYTPHYIVKYIVKNTVGELINGKTPDEISNIKIIDPACGSGSFLLEAYQQLLDYHLNYYYNLYNDNPEICLEEFIHLGKDGKWRLTIKEKKRILLHNIYGVDIDSNAVEVTKLSLLLKVLENEKKSAVDHESELGDKVLPNLGDNIKCGNSLIGLDILNEDLSVEEIVNINPFNYAEEFSEIFSNGGFDVVIGNPPYVKLHNIDKLSLSYYFENYYAAEKKCDLYSFFVERSLMWLLKPKGILGFIISNTWLNLDSFTNLREIIAKKNTLKNLTLVKNPFKNVSVAPVIFFAENEKNENYEFEVSRFEENKIADSYFIDSNTIKEENSYIIDVNATPEVLKILDKINKNSYNLVELSELYYGIMTANNKKYIISEKTEEWHKPLLRGKDIKRYSIDYKGDVFIDYRPNEMKKKKTARPGSVERFEVDEKIIFQRYSSSQIIATLDRNKFYALGTTILCVSNSEYSNTFLLGLINSKLLNWWYGRVFTSPTNYIREFEAIPIIKLDLEKTNDKKYHDLISKKVEKILDLNKKLISIESPNNQLKKSIDSFENDIDQLVYELYDLNDDEIKIVESNL